MENGQEEAKPENVNVNTEEVTDEKAVPNVEKSSEKEALTSAEPSAELLKKIKDQVEFYFGDVNMQRDKFLIEQTKLDEGWVPMTIMLNFKMLTSMSKDTDVILKALESSDLIEISEDRKKIRRSPKHPLPVYDEEYRKAQEARTIYVAPFPLEDTNIEKLKNFFSAYEPFENIIIRKYHDKEKKLHFKGSIFVQFKTLDDAKAFMARKSVKYEDAVLTRKWSVDYREEKAKEKEKRRQEKEDRKQKKLGFKTKKNGAKEKEDEESGGEEENEKETTLPKGCVIHISDVSEECTREDIKKSFGELEASIAFVDFKMGCTEGWVRLQGENSAKPVIDKMKDGKICLLDKEVTCRILEGEEEEEYLTKAKEEIINKRQKYKKGKKGKKGCNMQRGQRKRPNNDTNETVPAKKAALD